MCLLLHRKCVLLFYLWSNDMIMLLLICYGQEEYVVCSTLVYISSTLVYILRSVMSTLRINSCMHTQIIYESSRFTFYSSAFVDSLLKMNLLFRMYFFLDWCTCFQVNAVERTPSMSEINEILLGQVFMLWVPMEVVFCKTKDARVFPCTFLTILLFMVIGNLSQ